MPAYVVVQIAVQDPATYERYKAAAPASIAVYGGRYVVRGGPSEVLEGGWRPERLVVLEFPTAAQARAWWHSPEYAHRQGPAAGLGRDGDAAEKGRRRYWRVLDNRHARG